VRPALAISNFTGSLYLEKHKHFVIDVCKAIGFLTFDTEPYFVFISYFDVKNPAGRWQLNSHSFALFEMQIYF